MKISVYYFVTSCIIPRDYNISGRINLMEIPVLLHMLHFWKVRYIFMYSIYIQVLIAHAILTFTHLVVTPIPFLSLLEPFFQSAFLKFDRHHSGKTSRYLLEFVCFITVLSFAPSFNLRLILWEAGVSVSNKVLECLVLRSETSI